MRFVQPHFAVECHLYHFRMPAPQRERDLDMPTEDGGRHDPMAVKLALPLAERHLALQYSMGGYAGMASRRGANSQVNSARRATGFFGCLISIDLCELGYARICCVSKAQREKVPRLVYICYSMLVHDCNIWKHASIWML